MSIRRSSIAARSAERRNSLSRRLLQSATTAATGLSDVFARRHADIGVRQCTAHARKTRNLTLPAAPV